ncbi:MAG: hypothetical protein ROR55_19730 [Devosia sp.]
MKQYTKGQDVMVGDHILIGSGFSGHPQEWAILLVDGKDGTTITTQRVDHHPVCGHPINLANTSIIRAVGSASAMRSYRQMCINALAPYDHEVKIAEGGLQRAKDAFYGKLEEINMVKPAPPKEQPSFSSVQQSTEDLDSVYEDFA